MNGALRDPVAVVRALIDHAAAGDLERLQGLFRPGFFARLANGRIYTGADGFELLMRDRVEGFTSGWDGPMEFEDIGGGYVVLSGSAEARGGATAERVTGAWLIIVEDGQIATVVHYPSAERARAALPRRQRPASPPELVTRAIWAFNSGHLGEVIGVLDAEFRFTPVAGGPEFVGIAALVELQMKIREQFDAYVFEQFTTEEFDCGFVIVEGVVRTEVEGESFRADRWILARVVDSRVTEWTLYFGADAVKAALAARLAQE